MEGEGLLEVKEATPLDPAKHVSKVTGVGVSTGGVGVVYSPLQVKRTAHVPNSKKKKQ